MYAPSFDCSKAGTRVERLICASSIVADADKRLAVLYKEKLTSVDDKLAFKERQQRWIRAERESCKSEQCLLEVYQERIAALSI